MNSSTAKWKNDLLLLALVEPEAINDRKHDMAEMEEYDRAINECREMIEYYKEVGNNLEVNEWKRMLQQIKTEKRCVRDLILNNSNEVEVLTA